MSKKLGLIIYKVNSTTGSDVSELVSQIKLSGRKGSASRTIDVTFIDDDTRNYQRINLELLKGYRCIFTWEGKEVFRGVFFKKIYSSDSKVVYKAYDFGIYLANNKDSFCYENSTLTHIFKDICFKFGINYSFAYQTAYLIPALSKSQTTAWDALCDAMSQQYLATGNRYYIDSSKDTLRLMKRIDNIKQWVLESGSNLISYSITISIESLKTRFKLYSNEDTVIGYSINHSLESNLGIMQEIESCKESLTEAQVIERVSGRLQELIKVSETIRVDSLGIIDVISGVALYISIPGLNIQQTYYVDSDTHTFTDNHHQMSLTLNKVNDSEFLK